MIASKIEPGDLGDFQHFYADPKVMSTLSADGKVWPPDESAGLFQRHLDHWTEHGFGTWVFRDPAGAFLGRAGLRSLDVGNGPEVELFYGVDSGAWGRGLATEMARELIRVAFDELGLDALIAFTLPTNAASRRVLDKCGFEQDGEITHAGLGHLLFRLKKGGGVTNDPR